MKNNYVIKSAVKNQIKICSLQNRCSVKRCSSMLLLYTFWIKKIFKNNCEGFYFSTVAGLLFANLLKNSSRSIFQPFCQLQNSYFAENELVATSESTAYRSEVFVKNIHVFFYKKTIFINFYLFIFFNCLFN